MRLELLDLGQDDGSELELSVPREAIGELCDVERGLDDQRERADPEGSADRRIRDEDEHEAYGDHEPPVGEDATSEQLPLEFRRLAHHAAPVATETIAEPVGQTEDP